MKKDEKIKWRSALAFLTGSMIGIGYLTLPASCKAVGVILGLLLILFSGVASLFSEYLLLWVYKDSYVSNYPDLVKEVLGI